MCKSSNDGGKRCEYADMIANVRKKARYKLRDAGYNIERDVQKEVVKWQSKHPEIVMAHLPDKQPFQRRGGAFALPDGMSAMLSPSPRTPITGKSEEERVLDLAKRHQENVDWHDALTKDEERALGSYSMSSYSFVNAYLRRRGLSSIAKKDNWDMEELVTLAKKNTSALDSALKKTPQKDPTVLYRYHEVPAGVTPGEYVQKYFEKDGIYHEDGYLSTSSDPEFIMAHLYSKNKGHKNKRYIVMEMISAQGGSMQTDHRERSGSIQSLESEILLPRNMDFNIVSVRKSQQFTFASDRQALSRNYFHHGPSEESYQMNGKFKKGDTMSFPLIQMVDKRLTS